MSADVRSIAAVIDWHAALTTYGDGLSEAMAGVDLEIRRAYDWLDEQLKRWQRAVRDCEEEVVRAKAELSQRKFPNWDGRDPDCTVQEKALRLAKGRLEHAEEKVQTVRRWLGRLPKMVDEMFTGSSRRLKSMLEADLPNALTELNRRIAALESYAGLRADFAPAPSVPPPPPSTAPAAGTGEDARPEGNGRADAPAGQNELPPASERVGGAVGSPLPFSGTSGSSTGGQS
ncbi:MAG TPA: hypothetical protein VGE74_01835 [Gemmata sp.]